MFEDNSDVYVEVEIDYFGLDYSVDFGIWSTSDDLDLIKGIFEEKSASIDSHLRYFV